jgi:hypothetical protein
VQENEDDDDILTKEYFPGAHTEGRKGQETGLFVVIANGTLGFGGDQMSEPWRFF